MTEPSKIYLPFAESGTKRTIPVTDSGLPTGRASLTEGFPPETFLPKDSGGVPPDGRDMNGILYQISAVMCRMQSGAGFVFDSAYSAYVGGYPAGARVMRTDGNGWWMNLVDGNATNPEAPGAANWVPDFAAGVSNITIDSATVTPPILASAKPVLILSGARTSVSTLVLPDYVGKQWSIINNSTGSVIAKSSQGVGVEVSAGRAGVVTVDSSLEMVGVAGTGAIDDTDVDGTGVIVSGTWDPASFSKVHDALQALFNRTQHLYNGLGLIEPVGSLSFFCRTSAPSGWLELTASTQFINPQIYPDAFAAWGTTFGGDGVSTMGLPTITEGYALLARGSSAIGTATSGDVKSHSHVQTVYRAGGNTGDIPVGFASHGGEASGPYSTKTTGATANMPAGVKMMLCIKIANPLGGTVAGDVAENYFYPQAVSDLGSIGSTMSLDFSQGTIFKVAGLTANTTVAINNIAPTLAAGLSLPFTVHLESGTGGYSISWPANWTWATSSVLSTSGEVLVHGLLNGDGSATLMSFGYGSAAALQSDLADQTDPLKGAGMVGVSPIASTPSYTEVLTGTLFAVLSSIVGRVKMLFTTCDVDVRWFGAVGDGVTDDRDDILSALAAGAGRKVNFEPGKTYLVTDEVVVPDRTIVDLQGSTLRFACVGAKRNLAVGNNCVVRNGTVENYVGTPGQQGTFQTPIVLGEYTALEGVENVTLEKLEVKTVTPQGNGIAIFGNSNNIRIQDIEFPDSAHIGIPIMAHWSFLESGGDPYIGQTTHPHNLKISNIKCGDLTYNAGSGWFGTSVVFLSATYNVEVENVEVKSIPHGKIVTVYAGDWGYQFGTVIEQDVGASGIKIKNIHGKCKIAAQVYNKNPLEVVKKVWPGSIEIEGLAAVGYGGTDSGSRGIRVEGCEDVTVRDCTTIGFANGDYIGSEVVRYKRIGGKIAYSNLRGMTSEDAASGVFDILYQGVNFSNNNASNTAAIADAYCTSSTLVAFDGCTFDSPLASWSFRAENTTSKLRVLGNHTKNVSAAGSVYSFGAQSDTAICDEFRGNTSDISPAGGMRSGQLMIPVYASARHGQNSLQRVVYYDMAPDRGNWSIGDICWNSAPNGGQPKGWYCTAAGTPGTWVSMGNL